MIGDDEDIRQFYKDLEWADTKHILAVYGGWLLVIAILVGLGFAWFTMVAPNF